LTLPVCHLDMKFDIVTGRMRPIGPNGDNGNKNDKNPKVA